MLLSTARGPASAGKTVTTVAGPTSGIEVVQGAFTYIEWISDPIDADTTISGSITFNLRAAEDNMSANAAINCRIERLDSTGYVVSQIVKTARTTELGTAEAAANFTATPTSTNMLKGDRFRVTIFADDAGTMGTGFTVTVWVGGPTAAASGDTYITFNETFGFLTTSPTGSVLYLTDVAGPAVGANVEKEMWTARGDGVNTAVVNCAAGWLSPIQYTDTAGGTAIEWYSKQLTAFTLSGLVRLNPSWATSNSSSFAGIRGEIAVVNADGSGAVVWAANCMANTNSAGGDNGGSESTFVPWNICGDDLAVTDGQRLRLRFFIDDAPETPMTNPGGTTTCTLYYDGTSGGATGDSFITLTQTVTEYVAVSIPRNPGINHSNPALV